MEVRGEFALFGSPCLLEGDHKYLVFSNGLMANFPRHYWLWKRVLDALNAQPQIVGAGPFNVFGPLLVGLAVGHQQPDLLLSLLLLLL